MKQTLKEEEIIELIKEYLKNSNTDNAILIDGEWGSGKTFFVKNKIIKDLTGLEKEYQGKEKKIKFIYISTYGIKDTKELDNKLFDSIIGDFLPNKVGKFHKIIEKGISSIYDIIKAFKELPNIPKDSVRNLIEIFQNEKDYTIVFDDIERCDMPINELLGYINEFVEHKKLKVILIANQKEIAKKKVYSNVELKYIVAVNKDIIIPKKSKRDDLESIFNGTSKNAKIDETVDLERLNERVEKIFGEDLLYNQIKEKLIGTTIYYEPELNSVLMELIDKQVQNIRIKKYLKDNSEKIIKMMESKNHINIRTLKIAIRLIEKIFTIILNMNLANYGENNIENCKYNLLLYIIYACIKYKEGLYECVWTDKSEFGYISSERIIDEYIVGFKFINEIVIGGYIDENRVKKVVELYVKEKSENSQDYNDPLRILEGYWELEDKEIEHNFNALLEKLTRNAYNYNLYPKILLTVMRIVNMGFNKSMLASVKQIIIKNIEDAETFPELDEFNITFINQQEIDIYNEEIQEIKDIIVKKMKIKGEYSINSIINNTIGWGEKFNEYCLEHKNEFLSKREFFKLIDVKNALNCIKLSTTKDISNFRRRIASTYGFRNIKDYHINDIKNLQEFLNGLNSITEDELKAYDKSKIYNIKLLKESISDILIRLK